MEPISREFLLKQNKCCNNGCTNCPYQTNKKMNEQELREDIRLEIAKRIEDILQVIASAQGSACKVAAAKVELLSLHRDLQD